MENINNAKGVFVFRGESTLVSLQRKPFANEDQFQKLLATFPDLLVGDQIDADSPRRWLLISREQPIQIQDNSGRQWALDLLFLDQDGIPTLVEVKRAEDLRLRREVVGQMLDYAANCGTRWSIEELRAKFESTCSAKGERSDEVLKQFLDEGTGPEQFWKQVTENLEAGRIRLLFVADHIPDALRRIVEFLNQHMEKVEVLAIEIRHFEGEGQRILVPLVYGQTSELNNRKGSSAATTWDQDRFFSKLRKDHPEDVTIAEKIYEWMRNSGHDIGFGRGAQDGSANLYANVAGQRTLLFAIWTYGQFEVCFQHMAGRQEIGTEAFRRETLRQLNSLQGISRIPDDRIDKRPSIPLKIIARSLVEFFGILNRISAAISKANNSAQVAISPPPTPP